MTVEYWLGEPFDTAHEREAVQELLDMLESAYGNAPQPYFVLGNFRLSGRQLDLTIIKRDAVIVIDIKQFSAPFVAKENGPWLTVDGTAEVRGSRGGNPLQQVTDYRFLWIDFLSRNISKINSLSHDRGVHSVSTMVAIRPYLPDGTRNEIGQSVPAFRLVGFNNLVNNIYSRTTSQFDFTYDEMRHLVRILNLSPGNKRTGGLSYEAIIGAYRRGGVPHLPPLFVGRQQDIIDLKQRLGVLRPQLPVTSDDRINLQVMTAMRGWPGVGKTTLATVLAYEHDVVETFSDGMVWASLGESPDVGQVLRRWARQLGVALADETASVAAMSQELALALHNRAILFIIDDVWQAAHAEPLCIAGHYGATLITTRLDEVARALAARSQDIFPLNVLSTEASLALLRELAPGVVANFPQESWALVTALEGLPLALRVAGRVLNTEYERGFTIRDLLAELPRLVLAETAPSDRSDYVNATTPTVRALLKKSTDLLNAETRLYYAYLGAFAPKPARFLGYEDVARRIWEIDAQKAHRVFSELMDYGLLERQDDCYAIHALLVLHAQTLLDEEREA